ncbi:MAG TPA: TlyA family RNA methyltransferase [Actinomycetota bacterium]|nr:TlyA family RNA methyltransferase [Actinomycetota bacterium]
MRYRLDEEMVRRGLVASLGEASEAIRTGGVTVGGRPALKPGTLVAEGEPIDLPEPHRPFASRGGGKLATALDRFGLDPLGRRCLDAGASTGGFTDALLERGAAHVVAVDVGYGQLAWRLRTHPRVTVMERTNVRDLRPEDLPYAPELVVADLSFISLAKVVPALSRIATPRADLLLLVKPQFEAERGEIAAGGVVSNPAVRRRAVETVATACRAAGAGPMDVTASPLLGPAGNVEIFLWARKGEAGRDLDLDAALDPKMRRHA